MAITPFEPLPPCKIPLTAACDHNQAGFAVGIWGKLPQDFEEDETPCVLMEISVTSVEAGAYHNEHGEFPEEHVDQP